MCECLDASLFRFDSTLTNYFRLTPTGTLAIMRKPLWTLGVRPRSLLSIILLLFGTLHNPVSPFVVPGRVARRICAGQPPSHQYGTRARQLTVVALDPLSTSELVEVVVGAGVSSALFGGVFSLLPNPKKEPIADADPATPVRSAPRTTPAAAARILDNPSQNPNGVAKPHLADVKRSGTRALPRSPLPTPEVKISSPSVANARQSGTRALHRPSNPSPALKVHFDGSITVGERGDRLVTSLTKDLLAMSLATDKGQTSTPLQASTAATVIKELEGLSQVNEGIFTSRMDGAWELMYSGSFAFLSSPFFMTRRAACTSVQDVKDYDNACNILQEMLSVGRRGKVRQIIRGDEMISEVEFFGGGIAGAMVSVANIRRSANWKSSWDIFLKSFQVKGINDGPLVRQLVQIKGPIGMKIPIAVMHTTYCDDTLRIARDQSGNAFVFGRVSSLTEATDYTTIARETAKLF